VEMRAKEVGNGKWEVGSGIKVAILNRSPRLSQSQGKLGWVRYLLPFPLFTPSEPADQDEVDKGEISEMIGNSTRTP